ncbi:indole-3-glycerol phosphate synthase TrpC [candidate division KSB1 bacterium]|nr:indole-3-glycerol phosphate synthase TrpC [candidate division KSB1 bacterium]
MHSILNTIVESVYNNNSTNKSKISPALMRQRAEQCLENHGQRFESALNKSGIAIIAEVKKASPSKGVLCADFNPVKIACDYHHAGADAISVLTESQFFQGHPAYLQQISRRLSTPLLCKDFIIDIYQIDQAAVYGASAVLLIAALLDDGQLHAYLERCSRLQLAAVVEVHNEEELQQALDSPARIIGINNRDLSTFEVSLQTSLELVSSIPASRIRISESGILDFNDVQRLAGAGFDAVLVGESLMRQPDHHKALQKLRGVECG